MVHGRIAWLPFVIKVAGDKRSKYSSDMHRCYNFKMNSLLLARIGWTFNAFYASWMQVLKSALHYMVNHEKVHLN